MLRSLVDEAKEAAEEVGFCSTCKTEYNTLLHKQMRCPGRRKTDRRNNTYCKYACGCHGTNVANRCADARTCRECAR
jgi:hypothetical protein